MAKRARSEAEEIAELCVETQAALANAGRALHDDVGPQLAGAGILLSLVKADYPAAAVPVQQVLAALETAMESVRALSQKLNPSPVDRLGLASALQRLSEREPRMELEYSATAQLPREVASTLYSTTLLVLDAAFRAGAEIARIRVTGNAGVKIRIQDNGRTQGRKRDLAVPALLAKAAGASVSVTTGKGTIVLISHANRRSTGR